MKRFNVAVHYEGTAWIMVEAQNRREAMQKAKADFEDLSNESLGDMVDTFDVCECWRVDSDEN